MKKLHNFFRRWESELKTIQDKMKLKEQKTNAFLNNASEVKAVTS